MTKSEQNLIKLLEEFQPDMPLKEAHYPLFCFYANKKEPQNWLYTMQPKEEENPNIWTAKLYLVKLDRSFSYTEKIGDVIKELKTAFGA